MTASCPYGCPALATVPVVTFTGWIVDVCPAHAADIVDPLPRLTRLIGD